MRKLLKFKTGLVLFISLLLLDIITKFWIQENVIYLLERIKVTDFFNIVYVLNPGAAFGIFSQMNDDYRQIFFVLITLFAIVAILYLFAKEANNRMNLIAYSLILTGAVGNLIDRVRIGKVVDFLDFHYQGYHWPAFNVADICISLGITLLIFEMIFKRKRG